MTNARSRTTAPKPPGSHAVNTPWMDAVFSAVATGAAWLTLGLMIAIIVSLVIGAGPALEKFGFGFLTSAVWDPVTDQYGGLVMIYGTLMTSAIALLIAVPVSFGIALFLTEICPTWLKRPLGTAVELLFKEQLPTRRLPSWHDINQSPSCPVRSVAVSTASILMPVNPPSATGGQGLCARRLQAANF